MAWNLPEIEKLLSKPKNHKKIAILREPFSQFKSAWNYYYKRNLQDKSGKWFFGLRNGNRFFSNCAAEPVFTFMKNRENVSLPEFVDEIMKNSTEFQKMPFWFRFNNSQSHDFGRQGGGLNKDISVKQLLKQFDLVLIMERMAESMVLLKNEVCLDWAEDDFGSKENRNKHADVELSGVQEKFIRENLINLDIELYEAASDVFEKKVLKSGGKTQLIQDYNENVENNELNELRQRHERQVNSVNEDVIAKSFKILKPVMEKYNGLCRRLPDDYLERKMI